MIVEQKLRPRYQDRTQFITIEIMFNSVEVELARRWAHGEVPAIFINRPVRDLRRMVRPWWHLYHESAAAAVNRNRTVWERSPSLPATALVTPALVNALKRIRRLIDLDALKTYRTVEQAEYAAIAILDLITAYYASITD